MSRYDSYGVDDGQYSDYSYRSLPHRGHDRYASYPMKGDTIHYDPSEDRYGPDYHSREDFRYPQFGPEDYSGSESKPDKTDKVDAQTTGVPKRGRLYVKVLKAERLVRDMDPYVILRFPEKSQSKGPSYYTEVQTEVCQRTSEPVWDSKFIMHPVCHPVGKDYCCKNILQIEVWDKDKFSKDDLMASGFLDISGFKMDKLYQKTVEFEQGKLSLELRAMDFGLQDGGAGADAAAVGSSSSTSASHTHRLKVTVLKGTDLKGDFFGDPEPYVVLRCNSQTEKTEIVKGKHPVWNKTYEFNLDSKALGGYLEYQVLEKDRFSKDDLLGSGKIPLDSINMAGSERKVLQLDGKGKLELDVELMQLSDPTKKDKEVVKNGKPVKGQRFIIEEFPLYRGIPSSDDSDYKTKYDADPKENSRDVKFPAYRGGKQGNPTPTSKWQNHHKHHSHKSGDHSHSSHSKGADAGSGSAQKHASRTGPDTVGNLHIQVVKVTGLRDPVDIAVKMTIEGKTIESTVRKNTTAPKWNESFRFFVRLDQGNKPGVRIGRTATKPLEVSIINKSTNREIGSTSISLQELYENKGTEVQAARLKDESGTTVGEINLMLKPIGFGLKFYTGSLRCRVIKANDLKKGDLIGKSDPYVVLSLRKETYQTTVVKNNQNPTWDQTFNFRPDVLEKHGHVICSSELQVQVMDKDHIGKDDSLGSGTVDLSRLYHGTPITTVVELHEKGKQKGTVTLEIEAQDFGRVSGDDVMSPQPKPAYHDSRPHAHHHDHESEDQSIAALREELHLLQEENQELERINRDTTEPLQTELELVRQQLERANLQIDRLKHNRDIRENSVESERIPSDRHHHHESRGLSRESAHSADGKHTHSNDHPRLHKLKEGTPNSSHRHYSADSYHDDPPQFSWKENSSGKPRNSYKQQHDKLLASRKTKAVKATQGNGYRQGYSSQSYGPSVEYRELPGPEYGVIPAARAVSPHYTEVIGARSGLSHYSEVVPAQSYAGYADVGPALGAAGYYSGTQVMPAY